MTTNVSVLRLAGRPQTHWLARLGHALNWLLDHCGEGPELICGDMDSSLLAIARDLCSEGRVTRHAA
ncbi:MAG TPA: hypothetical protein VKZ60_00430 [Chloroflexota bacterium]|jgi:hypothetical protein|nr:hypothetical protein [Chloroflexota bacterium]